MTRIIIPGPPGTGKTYRMVNYHLNKELNEYKTASERIAYLTFSNAATNEAKKRILSTYPMVKNFTYICTMHSLGTRELNIDTNTQLLKDEKWNSFKNFSQICSDLSFETEEDPYTETIRYKNDHMKIIEYARAKKIDVETAAIELGLEYKVEIWLTAQIEEDLRSYKRDTGMIEYSDMIKQFIEKDKCPPLDVVFLDEAQDLNPLQWDMFNYIESKCKRSYIAGDDDQTIYTFQGANPNIFMNLKGEMDPQIESRRCPRIIHRKALDILQHVEHRLIKSWLPRDADGKIFENCSLDNIDFSKGEWMVIARTNKMLNPIKAHLTSLNLRFESKTNFLLSSELLQAYQVWVRLNQGATVGADEAKSLYKVLNYNMGHVDYGFSSGKSLDTVDIVDIDDLMLSHGLKVTGSWEQLNFKEDTKLYIKSLLDSGDDLMKKARIKVSTIHGVKGEECENVVLFTGLEKIIHDAALNNPDPEHRLFFVGVTRARENLYIMEPNEDDYENYNIGEPI